MMYRSINDTPISCAVRKLPSAHSSNDSKKKYQRLLRISYKVAKKIKWELELEQNLGIIFFGK